MEDFFKVDLRLSKKIYKEVQKFIRIDDCYLNTNIIAHYLNKASNSNEYKIIYGVVEKNMEGKITFYRESFILNTKDKVVVDISSCIYDGNIKDYESFRYYSFKEYSLGEYLDKTRLKKTYTTLDDTLNEEVILFNKLNKKDRFYNPYDMASLLANVYGDLAKGLKAYKKNNYKILL